MSIRTKQDYDQIQEELDRPIFENIESITDNIQSVFAEFGVWACASALIKSFRFPLPCNYCHAQQGEACRTYPSLKETSPHKGRIVVDSQKAEDAWDSFMDCLLTFERLEAKKNGRYPDLENPLIERRTNGGEPE